MMNQLFISPLGSVYFSGVSFCFGPLKVLIYLFQIFRVLRSNSETTSKQLVSFFSVLKQQNGARKLFLTSPAHRFIIL